MGPAQVIRTYPIDVDGVIIGHVYRRRRTWYALGTDEERPTDHRTRAAASARLVHLAAARAAAAADQARRERARTVAPAGWRFVSLDAVQVGDVVRLPHRCVPVRGGWSDGALASPETFSRAVTLTRVLRQPNGAVLVQGWQEDDPEPYVLLITPRYAEVGALVPDA